MGGPRETSINQALTCLGTFYRLTGAVAAFLLPCIGFLTLFFAFHLKP